MMPHTMCTPKIESRPYNDGPHANPQFRVLLTAPSFLSEALQVHQKGMTFDAFFAELAEGIPKLGVLEKCLDNLWLIYG